MMMSRRGGVVVVADHDDEPEPPEEYGRIRNTGGEYRKLAGIPGGFSTGVSGFSNSFLILVICGFLRPRPRSRDVVGADACLIMR
jgi:hypothetical protein